jgi:hypothetical protein
LKDVLSTLQSDVSKELSQTVENAEKKENSQKTAVKEGATVKVEKAHVNQHK